MIFPGRLLLGRLRSPTSAPALWQMINSKMWALCRCSGGPMLLDARPLHRSPLAVCWQVPVCRCLCKGVGLLVARLQTAITFAMVDQPALICLRRNSGF
jgi:hypothetical protein